MSIKQEMLSWSGKRPIRDLIEQLTQLEDELTSNQLLDIEVKVEIITEPEEFDLDTEDGAFEYIDMPNLLITW